MQQRTMIYPLKHSSNRVRAYANVDSSAHNQDLVWVIDVVIPAVGHAQAEWHEWPDSQQLSQFIGSISIPQVIANCAANETSPTRQRGTNLACAAG